MRSRLTKSVVFILLMVGLLQAGIMAYSAAGAQAAGRNAESAAPSDTAAQEVEIPKKEVDISSIILKTEVEDMIISLDAANGSKNINNYRTLLGALDVPEGFQEEMEYMYSKGHKVPDVLIAYEFLYRSYGTISELEELVAGKESGESWNAIFKEYEEGRETFEPSNFEGGRLEEIFRTPGITPDDIIIADRTAQQTGIGFDELIAMRGQGMDWKTINGELELVNTSGELPRVAVTSAQVKNHMKETGLNEEQVIEALVLAQKLDKEGKTVIDKIKAGYAEEDIVAESLEEKYR